MISVATEQNRTVSFDFLPVHSSEIAGYQTRFQIFTVPGHVALREVRKSVMAGADGIAFVADSNPERAEANIQSVEDCRAILSELNVDPGRIPMAMQLNKRDEKGAMAPEEMDEALGVAGPSFLACALSGYQVFATLDWLTQQVVTRFHAIHGERQAHHGLVNRENPASMEVSYQAG